MSRVGFEPSNWESTSDREKSALHADTNLGGLELLVNSVKNHKVNVPAKNGEEQITIGALLLWIRDNLLKERPEMFLKGNSVRPGVLVLINDCDWELCGQLEATLEENDNIVFISTLHGG